MQQESEPQFQKRDVAAVLFALVLPTLVTLVYFVWAERFSGGIQQATYVVAKVVQFGFPIFWVLWVQRRRPRLVRPVTGGVGLGVVFGLAIAGAMLALYHYWLKSADFFAAAEGEILEKIAGMQLDSSWKFIGVGIFYSLLHSLLEEYYWRWFVFGQLKTIAGLRTAVIVSSLGFMAHHVIVLASYFGLFEPVMWVFSLAIAIGGAIWAWLYHRTGSLLGPWVSHLLVDAAIFLIGFEIIYKTIGN
jgi:membrane protease YdiL (CAAX protease family)